MVNRTSIITFVSILLFSTFINKSFANDTDYEAKYISFLLSENLPDCFAGLDEEQVKRLLEQREIQARWTTFTVDYDHTHDVLYLSSTSKCDDIEKMHIKYKVIDSMEYIFMYKEKTVSCNSYGKMKVFVKEDDEWQRGRKIEISWNQLFNLDEKDLERLRKVDQYPSYIINFKRDDIIIEIPWRLYTFGEGSDTDGFSMSKGKQPVNLPYRFFLK